MPSPVRRAKLLNEVNMKRRHVQVILILTSLFMLEAARATLILRDNGTRGAARMSCDRLS
jgi:hypothetical protein